MSRSRRALPTGALVAGLTLVAAACGGDDEASVPETFQVVEHPASTVGVPEGWVESDRLQAVDDADAQARRFTPPDATDTPFGLIVWAEQRPASAAAEELAILYSRPFLTAGGGDQTRRESIEVAGAQDGFVLEVVAEASELGGIPVRGVFASAADGAGTNAVIQLIGPPELVTDDLVADVLGSWQVSG